MNYSVLFLLKCTCGIIVVAVLSKASPVGTSNYDLFKKHAMNMESFSMDQIFVFSTTNSNWRYYDWDKITTLVEFGYHDDAMVKYAHSKNVSIVIVADIDRSWLSDAARRQEWVKSNVAKVIKQGVDGVNVDFESVINATEKDLRQGLTSLIAELSSTLKSISPRYQVTVDFAWSPACIDSRCYDYKAIADLSDFVFIMSYDERGQIFNRCCAWANSAINTTYAGLQQFIKMGIPPSKMVLGLPWYGYDYPCIKYNDTDYICDIKEVPFRGVPCSDAAGSQIGYSGMMELVKHSMTGRLWDVVAESPYATYKDTKTGSIHQIWYDDVESLTFKYYMAKWMGLLGVGMWEADSLDYSIDPTKQSYVREMWGALPGRNL